MEPPSNDADQMAWAGESPGAAERFVDMTGISESGSKAAELSSSRQAPCRYGRGCTHTSDPSHQARFWHPVVYDSGQIPAGAAEEGVVCNECGLSFHTVADLQLHMRRKTAWSNQGLVGCQVSCLVDNREWQEGLVTQFHKSGKHCIEFRNTGEKRWVNMLRAAFYIIERPPPTSSQECKEVESDATEGLAPLEHWTFCEEISSAFCQAQSTLHRAYGGKIQETGHKTTGHLCVTDRDKSMARDTRGSLLYGELLPRGLNKALGPKHLNAARATTVYDLGMGTGKVAMQAFLQFPNLQRVYGVELSQARYVLGERAMLQLQRMHPELYVMQRHIPGRFTSLRTLADPPRVLEMEAGNLFDVMNLQEADIVLLETDVAPECYGDLSRFLHRMRDGAQALTYLDLRKMWEVPPFPFRQVEVNRSLSDRFPTSWSVHRGHHFFLWTKVLAPMDEQATAAVGACAAPVATRTASRVAAAASEDMDKPPKWTRYFVCFNFKPIKARQPAERELSSSGRAAPKPPTPQEGLWAAKRAPGDSLSSSVHNSACSPLDGSAAPTPRHSAAPAGGMALTPGVRGR